MNKFKHNILTTILTVLKIKHTILFSKKIFKEYSYSNSLYNISKMLAEYGIQSQGLMIKNKIDFLHKMQTPFIAHCNNDFAIVYRINKNKITYIWKNKKSTSLINDFIFYWSGTVLLLKTDFKSIEPNYNKHYIEELFINIKLYLLPFLFISTIIILSLHTQAFINSVLILSFLVNVIGSYISYLLVLKQLHIQNNHANKICSLFSKHADCNNILESKGANILGFSWSEIGFSYFISNILITILFPFLYSYTVLINIITLPYTFWSIWYQKYKIKQWCILCLFIQLVIWILFILNLQFEITYVHNYPHTNLILVISIYAINLLITNRITNFVLGHKDKEFLTHQINHLKMNENIFKTLLKSKSRYQISKLDSSIFLGKCDSKNILTIITNPHCNPCAIMHERLLELLKVTNNNYCIQYIFSSFNLDLEKSCEFFIEMYSKMNSKEFFIFLDDWYKAGRYNKDQFYEKFKFDIKVQTDELKKHKEWLKKNQITATPTVLINGYELPNEYHIEDLKYFTNIIIE